MGFTVFDQQLPTGSRHSISGRAAYSIGPDRVIITTSSVAEASILPASSKNDHEQTVSVLEPLSSGVRLPTAPGFQRPDAPGPSGHDGCRVGAPTCSRAST